MGGGAAITAVGLAKLGANVGALGVVGNDGDWLVERLRGHKVDTSGIAYDLHEPTAFTVAISDSLDRTFFTYLGANRMFPSVVFEAASAKLLAHARHVHLACAPDLDSALELLRALRLNGCCVSLDVGWDEQWLRDPRALGVIREMDIFFPNQAEASALVGETEARKILEAFAAAGVRAVALKLGARGAALMWDGDVMLGDPFPVEAVDTTGAGDAFDAGFLWACMRGNPPEECLRVATICGALSTQALGGIESFPTLDQLRAAHRFS